MHLFKYIEFLLPKHNCVIIPDLGGFVVNIEPARFGENYQIIAPTYSLIFNQLLRYNDGLLATSISETENISYEVACTKIKDAVKQIKTALLQSGTYNCGNLGTLKLTTNDDIAFERNQAMTYPSSYGLTNVELLPLQALVANDDQPKKRPFIKYIMTGAAAAAITALIFISPIGDNIQQASFIKTLGTADYTSSSLTQGSRLINKLNVTSHIKSSTDSIQNSDVEEHKLKEGELNIGDQKPERTYYIVIGGDDSKDRAHKALETIKQEGFAQANIVEGHNRYRIYVASFSDKKEAERFLDIFRIENQQHANAWLHSQRNVQEI